ncbi:MAG: hypothetical protein WAV18_00570, partial [Roseiarcus sp.]
SKRPEPSTAQVAGFISEWWPASNRNGGRHQIGIGGRNASEFAKSRQRGLFGKGNAVTDLHPTTGSVAEKSAEQNRPQGFDNVGNRGIENFAALRMEVVSMI